MIRNGAGVSHGRRGHVHDFGVLGLKPVGLPTEVHGDGKQRLPRLVKEVPNFDGILGVRIVDGRFGLREQGDQILPTHLVFPRSRVHIHLDAFRGNLETLQAFDFGQNLFLGHFLHLDRFSLDVMDGRTEQLLDFVREIGLRGGGMRLIGNTRFFADAGSGVFHNVSHAESFENDAQQENESEKNGDVDGEAVHGVFSVSGLWP